MEVSRCAELPPEVWEMVANTLVLRFNPLDPFAHYILTPSLAALARCNRQLRHICTPLLYRAILLPRREDASAFFGAIANLVNPFTRAEEKPSQFRQINSISFNQGEDFQLMRKRPILEEGYQQFPVGDFTPALNNMAQLILLSNLTSLDLSNCIIPDYHFASLLAPTAPLRHNLCRLSLRSTAMWEASIDFILGYSRRYNLARDDQGFIDWLKHTHDEERSDFHRQRPQELAALSARKLDFAIEVYNDYLAFARFAPYYDPFDQCAVECFDPFANLEYLNLSSVDCDHHHIICGVLEGSLFPRLRHLEMLEWRLGATDGGLDGDQVLLLRRSISLSVPFTIPSSTALTPAFSRPSDERTTAGVIALLSTPCDYEFSLHGVDLSTLDAEEEEEAQAKFGDYRGPRLMLFSIH